MTAPVKLAAALAAAVGALGPSRALAAPPQLPPFSAEIVVKMKGEAAEQMKAYAARAGVQLPAEQAGRFFVSGQRMRMEMSAAGQQSVMIADNAKSTSWVLQPAAKTYMELPRGEAGDEGGEEDSQDFARFLASGGDVCATVGAKGSCKKLGAEKVNGRSCQSYALVEPSGDEETVCIDDKLHFPIRTTTKDAVTELRNVREGPQPAELFQVPAGYAKKTFGQ